MSHSYKLKWGSIPKSIGNRRSNHKLYIYAQTLQFYQCGTNLTFTFQQNKPTLIGDEEEIPIAEDAEFDEKEDQIALCLYGKPPTEKSFNLRAMKTIFRNIYWPDKGIVIRDLDTNLFTLQFFSMANRDMVLHDGPWSFDGKLLLCREVTGLEQPSEVKFDTTHF